MANKERTRKLRRSKRTRAKIMQTKGRMRLTVFRSNTSFYAQIISDEKAITLTSSGTHEIDGVKKMKKIQAAEKVGETIAQKAKDKKVKKVVFDKGPYRYHGRVKAFADAARKGGLEF